MTTTTPGRRESDSLPRQRFGRARMAALAVAGALGGGAPAVLAPPALASTDGQAQQAAPANAPLLETDVYANLTTEERAAVDRLRSRFGDEFLVGVSVPTPADVEARAHAFSRATWFAQELFS